MTPVGIDPSALLAAGTGRKVTGTADAVRELQVTFLTQLLQTMRKTVPQSDLLPRSAERDVYDGAFDRAVAEALAARDPLGLERALTPVGVGSSFDGKVPTLAEGDQAQESRRVGQRSLP